jgi:hypothetical protein
MEWSGGKVSLINNWCWCKCKRHLVEAAKKGYKYATVKFQAQITRAGCFAKSAILKFTLGGRAVILGWVGWMIIKFQNKS